MDGLLISLGKDFESVQFILEKYDGHKDLIYKINSYESLQALKIYLYSNDAESDERKESYKIIKKNLNRVLAQRSADQLETLFNDITLTLNLRYKLTPFHPFLKIDYS